MDFTTLDDASVSAFAESQRNELGAYGLEARDVADALLAGTAVIERRSYGFAVLQLKDAPDGKKIPFLWLLYVSPDHRGQRIGHRFVRELVRKYGADYHMSLHCEGATRRRFFGRLGFVVQSRDGEMRHMTTNKEHYRY